MKAIFTILFIVIIAFLFLGGCATTEEPPCDDQGNNPCSENNGQVPEDGAIPVPPSLPTE